jgi:hypothetical protein
MERVEGGLSCLEIRRPTRVASLVTLLKKLMRLARRRVAVEVATLVRILVVGRVST